MTICYCAKYVEKIVQRDYDDSGCSGDIIFRLSERINIVASSPELLLQAISEGYDYDGNYWAIGDTFVEFNRYEDDNGNYLCPKQSRFYWDNGRNVWLADYRFAVEKRIVSSILRREFERIDGITFDTV